MSLAWGNLSLSCHRCGRISHRGDISSRGVVIDAQVDHLRQVAETTIATAQLENRPPDNRVLLSGDDIVGRLIWAGLPGTSVGFENSPYNVVIDGHELTWEQVGQALEAFEGFRFRLILEDNVDEIADPSGT